jgi:hypothetical protein
MKYRKIWIRQLGSNRYSVARGLFLFSPQDRDSCFWTRLAMLRYYKKVGGEAMRGQCGE